MNLLYLKKFNNYYNKQVKYYSEVEDYIALSEDYTFNSGVDFNPGDGITTIKTANLGSVSFSPDYLLVLNENDVKSIVSRWFVVEMKRERNGQYSITLQRDLIADYFEELKTSPMFIYKGNLPASSPLIYNKENMAVNQIKSGDIPLKDFTDTSWIVGYISNDAIAGENNEQTFQAVQAQDLNTVPTIESLGISLNDYTVPEEGGFFYQIPKVILKVRYDVNAFNGKPINFEYSYITDTFSNFANVGSSANDTNSSFTNGPDDVNVGINAIRNAFNSRKTSVLNGLDAYFSGKNIEAVDNDEYNDIYSLNGKTVRSTQTGLYYTLLVSGTENLSLKERLNSTTPNQVSLYQAAMGAMQVAASELNATYEYKAANCVSIECGYTKTLVSLVPVLGEGAASVTIKTTHRILEDAPYSMFCLRNTALNLALAVRIAEDLDKSCYDLQLLPYCPVPTKVEKTTLEDEEIIAPKLEAEENKDYFIIKGAEDRTIDYLYFATISQSSFQIPLTLDMPITPTEIKVANDCDTYRLCSPNYNGIFEFSAVKNAGVDYFNVSYTYKPYSPYIHLKPNFKNLYGKENYLDARGLICGGDFSLPRTTDAWESYQLQNKNYQNIFDRQIETMDFNHTASMISGGFSAAAGAFGAGMGIYGLTGSAGLGWTAGGASAAGGIGDLVAQGLTYGKNKELTIDTFNMNLQNIRALPTSLSKVGAYNIDNKIFPFLEYYTCTETEKEAYRNKIKYEAMTVNAIGTINDYLDAVDEYNFFKATPIQLQDIADDYHVAVAIAQELEKGVYL